MLGFAIKIAHIGMFNFFFFLNYIWPPLMGDHLSSPEDLVCESYFIKKSMTCIV